MNISVTIFTDGVALFKSSKSSFWPVYLVINKLPPKQRFLRKNMVLWGLWQGTSKPKLNTFLHPFVVDMKKLYKDGTSVEYEGTHYNIRVVVSVATMDLQARASLLNSVPHNAEYGCIYCEEPGFTVPSGKGHCRHYPYRNREDRSPPRTEQSIQVNVEMALAAKKAVKGFVGKTVMKFLQEFHLPESVAIDYMHGILLGVMKKLMSLWFDGKYHHLPFFIGHRLEEVDKILCSMKPPYQINRTPRKKCGNVQHWKASEFRSWLLFYCIPCLKGILPDVYLTHLACLVEGIFILLGDSIPLDKLDRAEKLLQSFYGNIVELYGEAAAGLNVHNILHLAVFVKKWGPIWAYSCFAFESFNGELSKTVHGKGNVCGEIFWAVQREKIIASEVKYVKNPPVNNFLNGLLQSHDSEASYEIGFQCLVKKPMEKVAAHQLSEQIKSDLRYFIDNMDNKELYKAQKVIRNDHTFLSEKCGKVKQRNSFTIKLEKERESVAYVQAKCFIMDKGTKRVYAVCKGFSVQGTLIPRRVPSVLEVKLEREIVVVPVEDLKEHVVFIQTSSGTVIVEFSNFIERD